MVTPVTPPERLAASAPGSQGFVYAVTMTGTTGQNVAVPPRGHARISSAVRALVARAGVCGLRHPQPRAGGAAARARRRRGGGLGAGGGAGARRGSGALAGAVAVRALAWKASSSRRASAVRRVPRRTAGYFAGTGGATRRPHGDSAAAEAAAARHRAQRCAPAGRDRSKCMAASCVGEAKTAILESVPRRAPSYFEAVEASRRYADQTPSLPHMLRLRNPAVAR